jgi:hypothetical protein
MPTYNDNTPIYIESSKLARRLILLSLPLASACSGPFGIVIGPESTHNAYNRRVAIERQYVHGNQLTERDRQELNELLAEVK